MYFERKQKMNVLNSHELFIYRGEIEEVDGSVGIGKYYKSLLSGIKKINFL